VVDIANLRGVLSVRMFDTFHTGVDDVTERYKLERDRLGPAEAYKAQGSKLRVLDANDILLHMLTCATSSPARVTWARDSSWCAAAQYLEGILCL